MLEPDGRASLRVVDEGLFEIAFKLKLEWLKENGQRSGGRVLPVEGTPAKTDSEIMISLFYLGQWKDTSVVYEGENRGRWGENSNLPIFFITLTLVLLISYPLYFENVKANKLKERY